MLRLLGEYKNGNYAVKIYSNGTKIRETAEDEFVPSFAENCDVKITSCCDGGCEWCYEGCTPTGKHGDILSYKFLDTLHPYTELAINGNDLTHPDLESFMQKMKEKNVILNMTVNQLHFERHYDKLKEWCEKELIYGLGISLRNPTPDLIEKAQRFPNAVIHVINGVVSVEELRALSCHGLKLLILGYKNLRRGEAYYDKNSSAVVGLQEELSSHLFSEIIPNGWFGVVSFDNLAIEQLGVQEHLSKERWEEFYAGDDGQFTFYIDMVDGTFGRNSLASKRYPIMDSIDEMFQVIKNEVRVH